MTNPETGSVRSTSTFRNRPPELARIPRFPVSTTSAVLVIFVGYLLFFTEGIASALLIALGKGAAATWDFSSSRGLVASASNVGQIAGAGLLLWLVLAWLGLPRAAAGVGAPPRWRQTLLTTFAAVFALITAGIVFTLLRAPDAASTNQPVISNGWAVLGFLQDLRAGTTEEIILVAIPVLVGLRVGWSWPWILTASVAMRWPFHIYHGTWPSLPWAMIWGGTFAAAFLVWRRLLPLIAVHTWWDALNTGDTLGGTPGQLAVIGVGGAAVLLGICLPWYLQRRRLLNPLQPKVTDPEVFRLIRHQMPRHLPLYVLGLVAFAVFCAAVFSLPSAGPLPFGLLFAVFFGGSALLAAGLLAATWTSNAWAHHDVQGNVIGVLLWHTDGDGTVWVDGRIGPRPHDLPGELTALATQLGQNITLSGRFEMGRQLVKAGHYPAASRRTLAPRVTVRPPAAHSTADPTPA